MTVAESARPPPAPAAGGHHITGAGVFRYRAFISYSHRDKQVAAWLHHAIETYHLPAKLVGTETPAGPVPKRLTPVFRDRDELPASGDLGAELTGALRDSAFLVVICSPASARSRWVGEEILSFKRFHGEGRVLALIADGEPFATDAGQPDQECLPRPLRFRLGPDGELSDIPAEPIAADIRPSADGKRAAKLKIVAGLTGVKLDALVQRETQRRMRRLVLLASASAAGMVLTGGLAIYANQRRIEADHQRQLAEKETAAARAASDFLVGTFKLENSRIDPHKVTALSVLANGAERARTELATQPDIQSRLIDTIGRAYLNLGLLDEATGMLERSKPVLLAAGPPAAPAFATLGVGYLEIGKFDKALEDVAVSQRLLGPGEETYRESRVLAADALGQIKQAANEPKAALAAYDRAIALCAGSDEVNPLICARIEYNRGLLLSDMTRFPEAEASMLKANATYRNNVGEVHRLTGQTYVGLAQVAVNAGNLPLAEARIVKALTILRQVLDPQSLVLADALTTEGQIFQSEHKLDKARGALEQAIATYRKHFGGYHYLIGIAYVYLAMTESDLGHTDAALKDIAEAKHNYDVSYGKLNANHGDLLVNKAKILAKVGRYPEAMSDCAQGIEILSQMLGPQADYTKSMQHDCEVIAAKAKSAPAHK